MEFNINKDEFVCANCKHFRQHYTITDEEGENVSKDIFYLKDGTPLLKMWEGHCVCNQKKRTRTKSVSNEACYAFERSEQ